MNKAAAQRRTTDMEVHKLIIMLIVLLFSACTFLSQFGPLTVAEQDSSLMLSVRSSGIIRSFVVVAADEEAKLSRHFCSVFVCTI